MIKLRLFKYQQEAQACVLSMRYLNKVQIIKLRHIIDQGFNGFSSLPVGRQSLLCHLFSQAYLVAPAERTKHISLMLCLISPSSEELPGVLGCFAQRFHMRSWTEVSVPDRVLFIALSVMQAYKNDSQTLERIGFNKRSQQLSDEYGRFLTEEVTSRGPPVNQCFRRNANFLTKLQQAGTHRATRKAIFSFLSGWSSWALKYRKTHLLYSLT